jgi:hypothetical protein
MPLIGTFSSTLILPNFTTHMYTRPCLTMGSNSPKSGIEDQIY